MAGDAGCPWLTTIGAHCGRRCPTKLNLDARGRRLRAALAAMLVPDKAPELEVRSVRPAQCESRARSSDPEEGPSPGHVAKIRSSG
jgi:hypothetical protein